MWWLWAPVGLALAAMFIGAWVYDRRHGKSSTFGAGLDTDASHLAAKNAARLTRPGGFGRQ